MKKIIIIVTVPVVLETWLKGQAKFLSSFYEVEIITAYSKQIQDIEAYENMSIKTMDFTRKINIFKDTKVLLQLSTYLMKSRPHIVYTLTPKAGLLGMIAAFIARIPHRVHCVVGLPHLEATGKRKSILTVTEKITYRFASKIYCNSINLKKIVATMTKKPVDVIGNGSVNGVNTEIFQDKYTLSDKDSFLRNLGFTQNNFVITFVGRIVKDKGINELIHVFTELSVKHVHLKLLLIGDYKNETDPVSQTSMKVIEEHQHIKYLEFQEDVGKYMAISSVFVLPSYREGLPNVLIEAGSYGIPLVATNINGCDEVIQHGTNGLLVNKKDENDLLLALNTLISDKEYYKKIKNNVRQSIVSKYDQKFFFNALKNEFEGLE